MTVFLRVAHAVCINLALLSASVSAQITPSPGLIFFGNVTINTDSPPQTLTLKNTSSAAAFLSASQLTSPIYFRITGGSCNAGGQTLAAGQSCTLTYVYKRTDGTSPYTDIGQVFGAKLVGNSLAVTTTPLVVPVQSVNFGKVTDASRSSGSQANAYATVTLPFSPRTTSTSYSFSSSNQVYAANQIYGSGASNCRAIPGSPNTCALDLYYQPNSPELAEPILVYVDNQQLVQVNVVGTYVAAAVPAFAITPSIATFPTTLVGTTNSTVLTVKNVSTTSASILSVGNSFLAASGYNSTAPDFRISATTCASITLAPNATCTITVEFAPVNSGEDSAVVQVISPQGNAQATVRGYGVVSMTPLSSNPASINFGRWDPKSTQIIPVASIRISNLTNFSVQTYSIGFKNTITNFSYLGAVCNNPSYGNLTFLAQGSCVITVSYNASGSASDISNVLEIKSDLGILELPVSIDFAAAPNPLTISSVDIDPLALNTVTASPVITVKNNGTGTATVYGILTANKTNPVVFRSFKSISRGTGGTCPSLNSGFSLAAGQSCTIVAEVSSDTKSDLIGNLIYLASDVGTGSGDITANTTTVGARPLTVNPGSLDFGAVTDTGPGLSGKLVILTNPNAGSAFVSSLVNPAPGGFYLSQFYSPGSSTQCAGSYQNNVSGFVVPANSSCTILINYNRPNNNAASNSTTTVFFDSDVGATPLTISLAQIPTQLLQVVDSQLLFDSVTLGSKAVGSVALKNTGTSAVSLLDGLGATDPNLSVLAGGSCGSSIPLSIGPGVTCTLKFGYQVPANFGSSYYSGEYNLFSTGGALRGNYSGYVITNPVALTSDKVSVDFGRIAYGANVPTQTIKISNPSATPLQIFNLRVPPGFNVVYSSTNTCPSYGSLQPGICSIDVSFYSSSSLSGEILGNLTYDTAGGSIVIPLRAVLVQPPSLNGSGTYMISSKAGDSGPYVVTMKNTDSLPALLQSVTVSDAQFSVVGGTCGYAQSYVLLAQETCTLIVTFRPFSNQSSNSYQSATLSVKTSGGTAQLNLYGYINNVLSMDAPSKINVPQDLWIESDPISLGGMSGAGIGSVSGGEASVGCTGVYSAATFSASTSTTLCLRVKSASTDNVSTSVLFSVTVAGVTPSNNVGSFSVTTGQSLLPHYYLSILARAPDAAGKSGWSAELWRMVQSRADQIEGYRVVAFGFFNSTEYKNRNRADRDYISDLYQTFFNRTPATAEVDAWLTYLPTLGRDGLLHHFIHSAEFDIFMRERLGVNGNARPETFAVVDFYRGFFRRLPDSTGLAGWVSEYRKAQCEPSTTKAASVSTTARAISSGFLNSAEYRARATTNAQFVNDLYSAFLRRGADLGGFNGWKSQLDEGSITRSQLMDGFIGSAEFSSRVGQVAAAPCGS